MSDAPPRPPASGPGRWPVIGFLFRPMGTIPGCRDAALDGLRYVRRRVEGINEGPVGPAYRGGLAGVIAAWCLVLVAGWLPHYLTRPWYTDCDHFAMLAQLWDAAGKVPYRDVFSMQFPGEIYLYWGLGRLTGWGNTVAFYAVDAGMVLALCGLMIAWGVRRFGKFLPGLIGSSALLAYYLDKDYTFAGQRDWHATFYGIAGLVVLLGWSGRPARVASAIGYAMALLTRPQFALLLPAMAIAATDWEPGVRRPSRRGLGHLVEWGAVAAVAVGLGFAPLIAAHAFDDFLRCLRSIRLGSNYNRANSREFWLRLTTQLTDRLGGVVLPAAILALASRLDARTRREALVVVAALAGLFLYAPISPQNHPHYQLPFEVTFAVAACVLAGLLLAAESRPIAQVAALLLLWGFTGLRRPEYSTFNTHYEVRISQFGGKLSYVRTNAYGNAEAIGFLRSGELPTGHPPGYRDMHLTHPWEDVRGVILYLREHTEPRTPVANLALDCAAAINGVVPRLSFLPADNFSLASFPEVAMVPDIQALRETAGAVVVWNPTLDEEVFGKVDPVWKTIREFYRPEAKFGQLEVWRHVPPAPPGRH